MDGASSAAGRLPTRCSSRASPVHGSTGCSPPRHGGPGCGRGGALGASGLFGRSTRAATVQGSRYAAAALIDRAVEEARTLLGRKPLVVLTGGDAGTVRPLLRSRSVAVPDLVLTGLAVLSRGGKRSAR